MKRGIFSVLAALSLTSMLFSCGGNTDKTASDNQSDETHKFPDTLRVATLYTAEDPMTAVAIGTGKYVEFLAGENDDIKVF